MEGQKFSDLHTLNLALHSALEIYNNKQFSSKSYSRRDHFEDVERDVLRPLNPIRFELRAHLMVTVTLEDAKAFIGSLGQLPNVFAIEVYGRAVGSIGYFPHTDVERLNAEVGYWLAEEYGDRG